MAAGGKSVANRIMGVGLQGLFVLFPASCASVALYDIWLQGLSSPIAMVALGIAGIFFAARAIALGFAVADAVMDAARPMSASLRRRSKVAIDRLASVLASNHGQRLSQA
ncbi:hypothetical protein D3C71_175020 [compost metagenome]